MLSERNPARMAKLCDITSELPPGLHLDDVVINGITSDSREVRPGDLFLASAGINNHGLSFLEDVIASGAVVVLAEISGEWDMVRIRKVDEASPVPVIPVTGLKRKMGRIASRFYGTPAQKMRVVGVTGTNGKTSVSHFLAQCLEKHSAAAVIGTNGNGFLSGLEAAKHTTPDAVQLQSMLERLEARGARSIAMEVSSHALDQGRANGIPFHTAVFTNLTQDHLDYHKTMEAYADAKAKLFYGRGLVWAVINADDGQGASLLAGLTDKVCTVACGSGSTVSRVGDYFVQVLQVLAGVNGLTVRFDSSWGKGQFETKIIGDFNVDNLVLTLAVLLAWTGDLSGSVGAIERCRPVDGRMAVAGGDSYPHVVVDFAHTPDALEKALNSLRAHVRGRLICVFGCGGDRDKAKRPMMGEVASRLADEIILTDDNPRSEDPAEIVADIQQGIGSETPVIVEHDRASAIRNAIETAANDDWILVAGKGHENTQTTGDLKLSFNDMEQVQRVLRELAA